ncbi:MAG: bidirectional hydrogenase complex protein HoxE [Thermoflexales bacterium]|nr:bidirectional hydrogenase complex protein HoxE [Thermoflexales bacterium]
MTRPPGPPRPAGPRAPGAVKASTPATGQAPTPTPPQAAPAQVDKRMKLVEATMRRHGFRGNALIETLHTAQEAYGYLDDGMLRHVARSLKLPLSKVYGVATFYNLFTLKPPGEHACVVCLGTACYIKGAGDLMKAADDTLGLKAGGTTPNRKLSLLTARCFGSCALAPVAVIDGEVAGKIGKDALIARLRKLAEEPA